MRAWLCAQVGLPFLSVKAADSPGASAPNLPPGVENVVFAEGRARIAVLAGHRSSRQDSGSGTVGQGLWDRDSGHKLA